MHNSGRAAEPAAEQRRPGRIVGWLGALFQLAIGVFPFAPSGLVLAGAAFVAVWLLWFAGLAAVVVLLRRAPRYTPLVPSACLAIWLAVVAAFGSA